MMSLKINILKIIYLISKDSRILIVGKSSNFARINFVSLITCFVYPYSLSYQVYKITSLPETIVALLSNTEQHESPIMSEDTKSGST